MKKLGIILLIVFLAAGFTELKAQDKVISFGVKAGANVTFPTNIAKDSDISNDLLQKSNIGANGGLFFRAKIPGIGLFGEVEALYSYMSTEIKGLGDEGSDAAYSINRFDLPVHIGFQFFKFLQIYGGPSFNYVFSDSMHYDNISVASDAGAYAMTWNVGVRVRVWKISLDARYQFGNSKKSTTFEYADNETFELRANPANFSLGLAFSIF